MSKFLGCALALFFWFATAAHAQTVDQPRPWLVQLEAGRGYTAYHGRQYYDDQPKGHGKGFSVGALLGWQLSPRWLLHASALGGLSPGASTDVAPESPRKEGFVGLYAALFGATYTSPWGPYVGLAGGPARLQASNLAATGVAWCLRAGYAYPVTNRFQLGIEGRVLVAHSSFVQDSGLVAFHGSGLLTAGMRFGEAAGGS